MGGGDDTPPAPDYSPFIKMATDMAKHALGLSDQQQQLFLDYFKQNKGVSDLFTKDMLGQMDKWLGRSDEAYDRYRQYGQPLEESLYKEAADMARPAYQEHEAGKYAAQEAQKFAQARDTAMQKLESFGVDPSQTRAQALDLGTRVAEGAAQAAAANVGRDVAHQRAIDLRNQAIQTARGGAQLGQQNAAIGAQMGNQAVNAGLATAASGAQTTGTGPSWQQLANQSLGTAVNTTNTGFQNAMDKYKADQESSSGFGGILGTGLGFLTKFIPGFEGGGAIPEEMSPSNGAIIDDVPAQIFADGGAPGPTAQLNAGEFVIPEDVMKWMGEKGIQQMIMKARKEMQSPEQRPAQPQGGPGAPPDQQMPPGIPQYAGAIPMGG
jgi:hypothetical protein